MWKLIKLATLCVITGAVDSIVDSSDLELAVHPEEAPEAQTGIPVEEDEVPEPIGAGFSEASAEVTVGRPQTGEVHEEHWLDWLDQQVLINDDADGKDWEFARSFLSDMRLKPVVQNLSSAQKGKLERGLVSIAGLGERAAREADRLRDEDRIPRKNMMNHFRSRCVKIMTDWCEPGDSWFCSERFLYESLVFVGRKFCSVYDKEMRREVCFPEAQSDFNRAKLRIVPLVQ
ncbi:MAG: hypothetical protein QWI73_06975 [Alphaproteobacteria bacterium]|nr:hypothetical protein [Alphaproteobacteria bacterium]